MLINILNTLAITASLGSHLMMQPKNNLPNRNVDYSINSTLFRNMVYQPLQNADNYVINTEEETWGNTNDISKGQISGQKVFGTCIELKTYAYYENRSDIEPNYQGDIYEIVGKDSNLLHRVSYTRNNTIYSFYPTMYLYMFKIDSVGTTTQTSINIANYIGFIDRLYATDHYNNTQITNINKKLYLDYYTTNFKGLDSLFTTNDYNSILINKNAYDTYEDIISKSGYTTNRVIKELNLNDRQESRWDEQTDQYYNDTLYYEDISENIGLYPNGTTYLIMFTQMYLKSTTNNNYQGQIAINIDDDKVGGRSGTITGTLVVNPTETEVIDIPGVMISVLGMPFQFISTAFNLTIFPGTPYEINISTLFLSILAVLIFVFLLKIILNAVGNK